MRKSGDFKIVILKTLQFIYLTYKKSTTREEVLAFRQLHVWIIIFLVVELSNSFIFSTPLGWMRLIRNLGLWHISWGSELFIKALSQHFVSFICSCDDHRWHSSHPPVNCGETSVRELAEEVYKVMCIKSATLHKKQEETPAHHSVDRGRGMRVSAWAVGCGAQASSRSPQ